MSDTLFKNTTHELIKTYIYSAFINKLVNQIQLEKAKKYAERQLANNYSLNAICEVLRRANYDPEVIKEIQKIHGKKTSKTPFIIGIVIIAALAIFFLWPSQICETIECFVERADGGQSAIYREIVFGSEVQYRHRNGQLIVEFISFDPDEPDMVTTLLGNKQMNCPYRGIDSVDLFYDIESCQGPLRDALDELDSLI